jgi:hypothetical protein
LKIEVAKQKLRDESLSMSLGIGSQYGDFQGIEDPI